MELGNFSISLSVKDLTASREFYEALGFAAAGGDPDNGWLIMTSPGCTIGLFKGMFDKNAITFHPSDARAMERAWVNAGFAIDMPCKDGDGPAHCMLKDPAGNMILVDQH